ncbi:HPP family protein [Paraburkholderia elongata]|uniref:CBS domain-containing protein n=1 Tax=Paraburkholderia elongata TaxID=2675747 RepID=A0A972SG96_9BURK|nr:HPP family protein [Paraburkholderia elongata]NPT54703.1 CBS domain-containing protein [Paraburkholderia elongata]
MIDWLNGFIPSPISVSWSERIRSCIGALIGITITGIAMRSFNQSSVLVPFLVAPMGASAVLLFAVPASPIAQPWSFVGGNLISATIGVTCSQFISDPVLAAAAAIAFALCAMFALRCVHPPSGAVALTAVLGGPGIHSLGYGFVFAPIAVQSLIMLVCAITYHALTGHRYPHTKHDSNAINNPGGSRQEISRVELESALRRRGELLDIGTDDLASLLQEIQMLAYARSFSGLTCGDVMSRPAICISTKTSLKAARDILLRHRIKALPVTDESDRVIGIVTWTDVRGCEEAASIAEACDVCPERWTVRSQETLVDSLMTAMPETVEAKTLLITVVPMFAKHGHHHIPVVNSHGRLVGMLTQADVVSGLYQHSQAFAGIQRTV